jgi:hypothetical protein
MKIPLPFPVMELIVGNGVAQHSSDGLEDMVVLSEAL